MPVISDHVEIERKPKLGGGGPGKIPHRRGYGGGDDGDRGRSGDPSSRHQRLRRYRMGMVLCIISVTTLFIGLSSAYMMRQGLGRWDPASQQFIHDWQPLLLPFRQLWINTFLLLVSSISLELARRTMARNAEFHTLGIVPLRSKADLPWLMLTVLLGFGFLAGQIVVWTSLRTQGLFLSGSPSSSFFYMLTGLHALHLSGGLIALLYAACAKWLRIRFESQQIALDVTAWYWHFMGLLWVFIFGLLYYARG